MNLSECSPAGEGEVRLVRHLILSTEGFVPAKEREHWDKYLLFTAILFQL